MANLVKNHNTGATADGTHLQGYIDISYDDLVHLFGEPCNGDGYKVDAEWVLEWDDGTVTTIYNYKDGPNYCDEDSVYQSISDKNDDWHIGGISKLAIYHLDEFLDRAGVNFAISNFSFGG